MSVDFQNKINSLEGAGAKSIYIAPDSAVSGNRFIASLPATLQDEILSRSRNRTLEPGKLLQESGAPVEYIYFPCDGAVGLQEVLPDGQAIQVALIGSRGGVGLNVVFDAANATSRAVVLARGTATCIPAQQLTALAAGSETLRILIARHNDAIQAQVQRIAACNAVHTASLRICRWLLECVDALNSNRVPATQELIAELLGVRRTTVTFVAQALQKHGAIRYSRGSIAVVDLDALRAASCKCHPFNKNTPIATTP